MRENMGLYRGKSLDNGEWVYGWYCKAPTGRWPLRHSIIPNIEAEKGSFRFVEVDPETVGEFTGLYDSTTWAELTEAEKEAFYLTVYTEDGINVKYDKVESVKSLWKGKPIFEGDIVLDADEPCEIVFENCCWKEIFQGNWWSFIYDDSEVKIIGDVHDNPELLKGGEG